MPHSELEDLFVESTYASAVKDVFGVELRSKFMGSSKQAWSERVRDNFQDAGKGWSKALEKQVKDTVAGAVASQGMASLNAHRRGPIDALVASLEERLSVASGAKV